MAALVYPRICSVKECDRPSVGRDLCAKHYQRWRKYGDPLVTLEAPKGVPLRFIHEVVLSHNSNECLLWPYGLHGHGEDDGYGVVKGEDGRTWRAHRYVCQLVHGAPPKLKLQAAHSCGKRLCVNPRHLRWDTQEGNWADRYIHGTHNRGELQGLSKLTTDQVREIRIAKGKFLRGLAEKYDVDHDTIVAVLSGRSWSWLE